VTTQLQLIIIITIIIIIIIIIINPVHALLSYVLKVYFKNILSTSPLGFWNCFLSVKMHIKNSRCISLLPFTHMLLSSHQS